jgi:superfamily II DNA or RNA helicase
MGLRDIGLDIFYSGTGSRIAEELLLPSLERAVRYDRLSSYFTTVSLVSIGAGLESLRRRKGQMRLVIGAHDVDRELVEAASSTLSTSVDRLRGRLLDGVSRLTDELHRDRVHAVAWMLKDGFLKVRTAGRTKNEAGFGIFHSKRLIFTDGDGDVVAATGSPNETASGLGGNYEEVTVHMSWSDPSGYVARHVDRFEDIWAGRDADLDVLELDEAFADELLNALGRRTHRAVPMSTHRRGASRLADTVWSVIEQSPAFVAHNCGRFPLFPHQESVVVEACSRWPIRAVLADEVGLGKTFEAASVVAFALRSCGVKRVLVLTPPTLLKQWQDELVQGFGLPFHRYDTGARSFIGPEGDSVQVPAGPFRGDSSPCLAIVSRDLARGSWRSGHVFQDVDTYPDMVVLDEAHAVRKRRDAAGGSHDSLMRRLAEHLSTRVPHLLFLTATPLQVDARELHDMLEVLGLPHRFDGRAFERSLELLAAPLDGSPDLNVVSDALRIIAMSRTAYRPWESQRVEGQPAAPSTVDAGSDIPPSLEDVLGARSRWRDVHSDLLKWHPGAKLVVRNTRGALERVGYAFPERDLQAIEVAVDAAVAAVLAGLDQYLADGIGRVESALDPDRGVALGFLVSTYRQRVASSLASARDTLQNRRARILALLDEEAWSEEPIDDGEEIDGVAGTEAVEPSRTVPPRRGMAVRRAASIEVAEIEHVLVRLDALSPSIIDADPKVSRTLDLINEFWDQGRACLIFSRYTSTIRALVDAFERRFGASAAYAIYTGEGGVVWDGFALERGAKQLVTGALDSGRVRVVFCSDAASEGLNLQSASALVNVDVPWNPARLEQRIGRIARLGQRALNVKVVNLWYPESVEATIYARVLARKETMELALGSFPKLVADGIRSAVAEKFGGAQANEDVLRKLQEARDASRLEVLSRLWARELSSAPTVTTSRRIQENVMSVAAEVLRKGGVEMARRGDCWSVPTDGSLLEVTSEPGERSAFVLTAPWLRELFARHMPQVSASEGTLELGVVSRHAVPFAFAAREGRSIDVLLPEALPDVLRALWLGEDFDRRRHSYLSFLEGTEVGLATAYVDGRWPEPLKMRVPAPLQSLPATPDWAHPGLVTFWRLATVREAAS